MIRAWIDAGHEAWPMVMAWMRQRTGGAAPVGAGTALVLIRDGVMRGVAVWSGYHPEWGVIELSAACDDAAAVTPAAVRDLFAYPFGQLSCQAVLIRTDESNRRVRAMARRFGFVEHVIPRLRGREEAEVVAVLTAEAWRDGKFSKENGHGE